MTQYSHGAGCGCKISPKVLEVILGVSLATLCNFANNLAGTDINPQLQAFAPGALES